ncbi:hypothetical protein GCM10020260_04460 [Nesterenkonia halobia]|uniref:Uncharacterized protein n=1 Tax=Nesterenkonia halobia TaxID=37922 RepID=A0ABP6R7T9_9MICC
MSAADQMNWAWLSDKLHPPEGADQCLREVWALPISLIHRWDVGPSGVGARQWAAEFPGS